MQICLIPPMWRRIIIYNNCDTGAGDENLFSTLEKNLVQAIPADMVEWRRSFSRPIKQVKLGATFVPFSRDILPTDKDWHLIKQPIFHIYWTECSVSSQICALFFYIYIYLFKYIRQSFQCYKIRNIYFDIYVDLCS